MENVNLAPEVLNLLNVVADLPGVPTVGAYSIRLDAAPAAVQSTEDIQINPRKDGKPGIDIIVRAGVKDQTVYIPAIISHSGVDDLVYNDFYIGEGADVTIVAGCGVHSDGCDTSVHNGIHSFALAKNSRVKYIEKHIGTGEGTGARNINPQTFMVLKEGAVLEMDTVQLSGVDDTDRFSKARLEDDARLIMREKIMTTGTQKAKTSFEVDMDGARSAAELSSRSVAKDNSVQWFYATINGNNECMAHSECDGIIIGGGVVGAVPEVVANHIDAQLVHEAAIGKIAGEQIVKLMTLGLTEEEAEQKIIEGFLS